METLQIAKIGGKIVNDEEKLDHFLDNFTKLDFPKLLVHGGGSSASELCTKLDIPIQINNGRRITDVPALDVAVMVYAGLINKNIVAQLQSRSTNAIGLSGADLNTIPAEKRSGTDIDYGLVGDITPESINSFFIRQLLDEQTVPVFSAITHDRQGQLLNTNADTVAATLAIALANNYEVELTYCFEKEGVLRDVEDDHSLINILSQDTYEDLKEKGAIHDGMIPKLDTAFEALSNKVSKVYISHANNITNKIGTALTL